MSIDGKKFRKMENAQEKIPKIPTLCTTDTHSPSVRYELKTTIVVTHCSVDCTVGTTLFTALLHPVKDKQLWYNLPTLKTHPFGQEPSQVISKAMEFMRLQKNSDK